MFDRVIPAGQPVPEFSLARFEDRPLTRDDLLGSTTVLYFYPYAFSPVCTTQLDEYNAVFDGFAQRGATVYGVSCDSTWTLKAFRKDLGVKFELLSDYFPQGETCRKFGVLHPDGFPQRALVLIGPDGVVSWSYQAPSTGDPAPDATVLFEALDALRR